MGACMKQQVDKLVATGDLSKEEFAELLKFRNIETTEYLFEQARRIRYRIKKDEIEFWGRICISNYCKYDCKMCGICRSNQFAKRYRMNIEQILEFCEDFVRKGIYTFLLESGDDIFFTEAKLAEVIISIKQKYPGSTIILSVGEKNESAFKIWQKAGARGYILSHGSANEQHFKMIYPSNTSLLTKKQRLWELKTLEYQVGSGFLVGIPYQTIDNVLEELRFLKQFETSIIDVGAFIPTKHTPFEKQRSGNGEMTLYIMAILRLMLPGTKIIASPTLDCVLKDGRMKSFDAGADVLLLDIENESLLNQYGVYERKSGRFYLPPDNLERMIEQLKTRGIHI